MRRTRISLIAMGVVALWFSSAQAGRTEPNWRGVVVARGPEREQIESTDILDRPYRPLHFYGNTVRRQYYRGRATPTLRDLGRGTAAWVVRR